ncbi:DUF6415 family natural product biosynthesis protein [Streptomyces sp. NPDC056486]|uniref:DUF6415 family natural product biosynthesis protein n=1 Tax=Streptomyces sp. NPDC056486 TaxID=3345835 RepID=UPI0036B3C21B
MVAITREAAAELSSQCSTDDLAAGMLLFGLRRALAREAVSDELYDNLEAVLGQDATPTGDEVPAVANRLRTATTQLIEIVPYLVTPYPTDQMRCVINLSAEQPCPQNERGHLVRFASSILTLLDLMGEVAS